MIRYIITVIVLLISATFWSQAININSTAGSLASVIDNPGEVGELAITGAINAKDMQFIASQMPALKSLDLTDVTIVAYSGESVFGLTNHDENTIPAGSFVGLGITTLKLPTVTGLKLGAYAFSGTSVESIALKENIVSVGDACFAGCQNLTTVDLSASINGVGVFAGCQNLTTVNVGGQVELGDYCFNNCGNLNKINGSEKICKIGNSVFTNCKSLNDFAFGKSLAMIGNKAFYRAGLTEVNLSKCSSLELGDWCFAQMPTVKNIDLGLSKGSNTGIAFECPELTSLTASNADDTIGDFAYSNNAKLDSVAIINDNTIAIGRYAMSGMTNITTFTLPEKIEFIGDNAMERMTSLELLNAEAEVAPELGSAVWSGIDQGNVKLFIRDISVDSYFSAEQWSDFDIVVLSSITDAFAPEYVNSSMITYFEGDELVVKIQNTMAQTVAIYDAAGVMIDQNKNKSDFYLFNTAERSTNIYVIVAVLENGSVASTKIAKN